MSRPQRKQSTFLQLRLIEERLTLQMRYNDVLATKLDEALSRIKALEDKIEQSS